MKKLFIILGAITVSLSACLKDKPNVDFSKIGTFVELPYSGVPFFGNDAVTASGDTITLAYTANIDSDYPPSTDTKVTVGVDNTLIAKYMAINSLVSYDPMPDGSFVLNTTSVTIKGGSRIGNFSVTFYKHLLDPSKSYMLPVKIVSADQPISGNFNVHYFHFIGNDFAGSYTWDYRRYQNGTGPGAGQIPSLGQGSPPDITGLGQAGTISPISPTEFEMLTGYNSTGVKYDVTFTRTVTAGVVTYSNWAVTFNAANIALWTAAGISNMVPPKFTLPPPAKASDPKIFELNYVSGGASARYIDDTYTK